MLAPNLTKMTVKINYQTHSLPLSTSPKVLIQSKPSTFGKMETLLWGRKMDGQERKAYRIGKNPFLSMTTGLNFITPGSLDQMNLCCGMGRAALCIVKTAVSLHKHPFPAITIKGLWKHFKCPPGVKMATLLQGTLYSLYRRSRHNSITTMSLNLLCLKVNEQHISLP